MYRKLLDNPVFQNEKLFKIFIWCLLKASHKEHEQLIGLQKITLQPGQFIYGRMKASKELKIKESTVNKYMCWLKDDEIINIKSNNKFSVITIVNWALYQLEDEESNSKSNSNVTTKEQQRNTNKNVKNDKNVKNKDIMHGAINPPCENPPIITLTLNDKSEYPICQEQVEGWKELYQSVDINQELKKMKGWLISNPTKRKTKTGILRFVNSWLSKEQDKAGLYKAFPQQATIDQSKYVDRTNYKPGE